MSGLMGGSWRRGNPAGHLRVPGRCAEKRHPHGLIGTQLVGHLLPRQLPTRLRHGNSGHKFAQLDAYVHLRLARYEMLRHGRRGWGWTTHYRRPWLHAIGAYRLSGTVRWGAAHAAR